MKLPSWLRELFVRILLLFFGFILVAILLEAVLHVYWPYSEKFHEPNPLFGWRLIPNQTGWSKNEGGKIFLKINSKGLRDKVYSYENGENIFRILVLGDSYCEAVQVSLAEAFHKRLESLLNQRSKTTEYEVINCGVSGYGTDNELLFYKYEGYKYQPDLVILAFTVGNDISDNFQGLAVESGKPYFLLGENGLKLMNFPVKRNQSLFRKVKDFSNSYSKLYRFLYITFRERITAVGQILNKLRLMKSSPRKVQHIRNYLVFKSNYTPKLQRAKEVSEALILELKKEVETNDAKLLVVLIPKAEQVHEESWFETLKQFSAMRTVKWNLEKPNLYLKDFFEQNKIDALDLLPEMRASAKAKKRLFYIGRGHWNSEGHLFTARLLYDYLINNKYLPNE